MTHWWKIGTESHGVASPRIRAVAYYRDSSQDRMETSIPKQREQVLEWAEHHGVEIIEEFADPGGRPDLR